MPKSLLALLATSSNIRGTHCLKLRFMVNPANKLSEKPFFTKLGFFTKKGYVVYLSWALIFDYIFVLLVGKDKLAVLLFGMPYTVTILLFYHLIFLGGRYIFSKIKSLFGIDDIELELC